MRGSRTPAITEAKFRKEYLRLGNARAAARAVGLKESTAKELSARANADPKFAQARIDLNARALDEVEADLIEVTRVIKERILERPMSPRQIADLQREYDLKSFHFNDPRPQYYGQMVNAHRSLMARKKLAIEQGANRGGSVKVVLELTDGNEGSGTEVPPEPSSEPSGSESS